MKKILVISAGRSDYDRYYPIISELNKTKKIKLWLFLTRSHQENIFGKTINYISKEFGIIKNSYKRKKVSENDFSKNFCDDLLFFNDKLKKKKT
mgnify:CR=1 FL=1